MTRFAVRTAAVTAVATVINLTPMPAGSSCARASDIDDVFTLAIQPSTLPATVPTTGESRFSRSAENEIRFQSGLLHYNGGRLPEAEQDFKALVASDPSDSESYYYLGLSQL